MVTLTVPAALYEWLHVDETAAMEPEENRAALNGAKVAKNGSAKVTATLAVHRDLLDCAWTLAGGDGLESDAREVRAHRAYAKSIGEAERSAAGEPVKAPTDSVPPVRKAKAGHTLYTAPDGTTRESKRAYAAALAIFNPAEAIKDPGVVSFHGTPASAEAAGRTWGRQGYRVMVVPVTTDGTTDADLAARITAMRTAADEANIPAQEIAKAEAKRDRAAADVARYRERTPDPRFGETAETLAGWLAKAEEERDTAAATADQWRAQLASA
jgi:hypothetical protein